MDPDPAEYFPPEHGVHVKAPGEAAIVPAGHSAQTLAPEAPAKAPAAQRPQAVAPVEAEYVPTGHVTHLSDDGAPSVAVNKPAAHPMHASAPLAA